MLATADRKCASSVMWNSTSMQETASKLPGSSDVSGLGDVEPQELHVGVAVRQTVNRALGEVAPGDRAGPELAPQPDIEAGAGPHIQHVGGGQVQVQRRDLPQEHPTPHAIHPGVERPPERLISHAAERPVLAQRCSQNSRDCTAATLSPCDRPRPQRRTPGCASG